MKNYIEYFASNDTMGDLDDAQCDQYRAWALAEIEARYPSVDVTVSSEQGTIETHTNMDDEEEIVRFCGNLWDACPWDWTMPAVPGAVSEEEVNQAVASISEHYRNAKAGRSKS